MLLPFQQTEALGAAHGAHGHEVAALIACQHVTVAVPRALVEAAAEIAKDLPGTTANDVLVTLLRRGVVEYQKQRRYAVLTLEDKLAILKPYRMRWSQAWDLTVAITTRLDWYHPGSVKRAKIERALLQANKRLERRCASLRGLEALL